jgi:hypothetical protein
MQMVERITLRWLLRVAFGRWSVERCFHVAKDELGMDHYQVRGWRCLHRHFYLTQASHLFCARVRQQYDTSESRQTLSWVYEQEPSYLAWFHETVDGCEEVKEAIRAMEGIEAHLTAFRSRRQPTQRCLSPTQQEVEWLMGKFSAETVDLVCEELFGGKGPCPPEPV